MSLNSKFIKSILILFCFVAHSQNESKELLFKVVDKEDNFPIAYATIQFRVSPNGIIADEEGDFRVPYKYKVINDSLIITSIGYKTKIVDLESVKDNKINLILMESKTEELDEIIITTKKKDTDFGPGANAIVQKAIERISSNYPIEPFSYISYYRDYQLIDNVYYNMTEGIIESFDQGFQTDKVKYYKNKDALYSYKVNKDFPVDSLLANSIYNDTKEIKDANMRSTLDNELSILNIHDAIRNYNNDSFSFVNVFKENFIENHDLTRRRITYLDDEPLYEIRFVANDIASGKTYDSKGTIYISKQDFAIHKFNYSLFKKDENTPVFEVVIEYKKRNEKMYLNYITFNNNFIIKQKDAFRIIKADFDSGDKSFYLTFNKKIDEASIKRKSNIKLYYKRQKMLISNVALHSDKVIKVELANWNSSITDDSKINESDFSYKLKNIKDKAGFKINKLTKIEGYQFRELFVQQVNIEKALDENLIYIQKDKPIYRTRVNKSIIVEDFWLNSPLKTTKD
ncbi:carboxypeptidase-like protein [Winogradskyella wandonensis]|uniref:Carboxypeptidase-like protein n=1 Tax=Winogradskyella wandonensis TaxID=1442586 RepID=A0A4R1KNX7_9FLAO|nr:carboxypeptidase-like regulatory domain-containing protein [Winogradskyella wandonensis]TCK66756.1 carboxypeptidase-like protein [Winogradskyella wandonensis]